MSHADGIIVESILALIEPGLTVYDVEGKKVGEVGEVDLDTGWFSIYTNRLRDTYLHVPFSLIKSIDPRELFLFSSKHDVQTQFRDPPTRMTVVADIDGHEIATTTEPSGYDGTPVVVKTARVGDVRNRISPGGHVYSSDEFDLGRIRVYDSVSGAMRVERPGFSSLDIVIPVALVDRVEVDSGTVYLVCSRADLQRMGHLEPLGTVGKART